MSSARAATGPAPGSGDQRFTRRIMLNLLEAFFRRPWLYLLPLILSVAWGVATAAGSSQQFRSVGTISATRESLVSDLTQADSNQGFSWETPASVTARNVNELLSTRDFLSKVATAMGVTGSGGSNDSLVLRTVRQSVGAYADGENLVRIAATTDDPELARALAAATTEVYRQWIIDSDVAQSTKAEEFFGDVVTETQQTVDEARAALNQYVRENPVDVETERPLAQQLEIDRLQSVITRVEGQYQRALNSLDEARLATAQATTVVEQRLQIVDEPEAPFAPEPRLRKAITTVLVFGVLGSIISIALLVMVAMLDRTVRVPSDIESRLGLDVLAVVPAAGR